MKMKVYLTTETRIFIKLACSQDRHGNEFGGKETMDFYVSDQESRGYTWFSTDGNYRGMAQKRVLYFNEAIRQGNRVTMLFAIGKGAGGQNDIAYTANVLEVKSFAVGQVFPIRPIFCQCLIYIANGHYFFQFAQPFPRYPVRIPRSIHLFVVVSGIIYDIAKAVDSFQDLSCVIGVFVNHKTFFRL